MAVQLDPQLMDILACPTEDHAPLRAGTSDDPDADVLTCTACGRRYPVLDGIPVLLIEEALPPLDAVALAPLDDEASTPETAAPARPGTPAPGTDGGA